MRENEGNKKEEWKRRKAIRKMSEWYTVEKESHIDYSRRERRKVKKKKQQNVRLNSSKKRTMDPVRANTNRKT